MRLNEVRKIIADNIHLLNFSSEAYSNEGTRKVVRNIPHILIAINNLKTIPSLSTTIQQLESISSISSIRTTDDIIVTTTEANQFENILSSLNLQCNAILNLANCVLPQMDENTLCIKLPQNVDLKDLGTIASDFASFFSIILSTPIVEGSVEFVGVEAGSNWLYIKITGAVIGLINILIDAIYNIFDKYIAAKRLNLHLQQTEISNDAKLDIAAVLHALCKHEIEIINSEESLNLDPESLGKYVREIEKLVKILEMGTQVHPALTAPTKQQEDVIKRIERIETQLNDTRLLQAPPEKPSSASNPEISPDNVTEAPASGSELTDE